MNVRFVLSLVLGITFVATANAHAGTSCAYDPCESTAVLVGGSSQPHWFSCPQGDGEVLGGQSPVVIEVFLRDAIGNPLVGVPASDILLTPCGAGVFHRCINCDFVCVADAPTDEDGRTTFSSLLLEAGGCIDGLTVAVVCELQLFEIRDETAGCEVLCLPIDFRSPDIDGTGIVDLVDLSSFASSYPPGGYSQCSDLDANGTIDLVDLALFAGHFGPPGHLCVEVP